MTDYLLTFFCVLNVIFCYIAMIEINKLIQENADLRREIIAYQASLTNAVNGINHGHN